MTEQKFEINVITFNPLEKEKKFSFFIENAVGLFPVHRREFIFNVCKLFPELEGNKVEYLYSDFSVNHGKGKVINIDLLKFKDFAKHYYNFLLFNYFKDKVDIINSNFVRDIELWFLDKALTTEAENVYKIFTLKIQNTEVGDQYEIVITFSGISKVLTKNILEFTIPTELFNKVVYQKRIYKYTDLTEEIRLESENIYPVLNNPMRSHLEINFEFKKNEFKYRKYYENISWFLNTHLLNKGFQAIFPITSKGFLKVDSEKINITSPGSNLLVFGKDSTHINPYLGIKENGPYRMPKPVKFAFFIILHNSDIKTSELLINYFKGEQEGQFNGTKYKIAGLSKFARIPFALEKGKSFYFTNMENPLPEISEKLSKQKYPDDIRYCAIYISPFAKDKCTSKQLNFYYQIKEELLKYGITSQVIEKETIENPNFKFSLPNIYIAILAKLEGIPWRLKRNIKNELVVGIGAFKSVHSVNRYIGSAFCFSNDGHFHEFDCYSKADMFMLTGSIEKAVKTYIEKYETAERLVIHFYKAMNEDELKPIIKMLDELDLEIPVVIISVNKTESKDLILFDKTYKELMPLSGTFYPIGNNKFILCNNTRYNLDTKLQSDEFPFPVKIAINSTDEKLMNDQQAINDFIDQVYQFSRMYWKSVSQQNLPVTIKYPEMVAQIFPHFENEFIPTFGKNNLWFL